MPAPAPFSPPQPSFPALYLYPLNDSFVPKHITLAHGQHVKIGRQTNAKTTPGERNGYFDSKVLSRQHAEVWEEAGKVSHLNRALGRCPRLYRAVNLPSAHFSTDLHQRRQEF